MCQHTSKCQMHDSYGTNCSLHHGESPCFQFMPVKSKSTCTTGGLMGVNSRRGSSDPDIIIDDVVELSAEKDQISFTFKGKKHVLGISNLDPGTTYWIAVHCDYAFIRKTMEGLDNHLIIGMFITNEIGGLDKFRRI